MGGIVLYVDDEWTNRTVFEKTFGSRFRVLSAASGKEALEKMRGQPVAVLVTDQRMPEMSGNQLLEQVRKEFPAVARVVVTAYSDVDPILQAVNQGLVARYVVKPWDKRELEEILAWGVELWERSQGNSEIALRLLQAERLITLGTVAQRIFHDINNKVGQHIFYDAERLAELASSSQALGELVKKHGKTLSPRERKDLTELAEELPVIAEEMVIGGRFVVQVVESFNRILRATPNEKLDPARPRAVIDYALSVFREGSGHIQLLYEGPDTLPPVAMGTTELAQVLINLVSNAVQALPPRPQSRGGSAERPMGRVVVSAREEGPQVCFAVADDGRGMPPEVKEMAGTMFFSTRPDGAGLGLAQVRRLVAAAKGELKIVSAPGAGTRIDFAVPKAA